MVEGIVVSSNGSQLTATNPTAYVSASPQMPAISMQLFGISSTSSVQWNLRVTYSAQDKPSYYSSDTFTGTSTGSGSWTPNWNKLFRGGTGIVTATAGGVNYTDTFFIHGLNPPAQAVDSYIGTTDHPWFWQFILSWESRQTYRQFDQNDLPNWNNNHGFGMSQIDPPASAQDLWNWQSNISDAATRLKDKKDGAYQFNAS